MIEVANISKTFGDKQALKDISFKLAPGEVVALIGENGAGKSTLMRIMTGFLRANRGTVNICGNDIETQRIGALAHIGYVPEISALYGDMTVYDFLRWIAGIWQIQDYNKAILATAEQMKITDVLPDKIESLSKGFKKRVEIASALLHKPTLLILDEPTDGLDPNQKYDIRKFIKNYAKKNIVLVSTHVLEDANVANRVIMLADGAILRDTDIEEFKKVSHHKDLSEAFRILSQQTRKKK